MAGLCVTFKVKVLYTTQTTIHVKTHKTRRVVVLDKDVMLVISLNV